MDTAAPTLAPDATTERILAFIEGVGIPTAIAALDDTTFMPGMTIRDGVLIVDPAQLTWPGDLLHEAGHIAVTEPEKRPTLHMVSPDPGEEMSAICWSYAAALAMDLDPRIVFHDGGYRGGGGHMAGLFAEGTYVGLPMLQYFGLAFDTRRAAEEGTLPFPHMQRWLR
ncbi:hypothetical protein [Sphingomonas alpina]|uniref:Uncharacterized protein n=1 Tax=Sphingomonas alpina TaxID=653931 RepID=A0A7H0LQ05_9SPHN|nr:hypothetical protein [Sphingomonas alpina]QNQ11758.1 hypothetical protein H3Z74_11835 [Sphingomonas alpina]